MQTQTVKIANRQGLHSRMATAFVKKSSSISSTVVLLKDDKKIDGKSIMGVMVLAAKMGDVITLEVDGSDETEAIEELIKFLETKYD